MTATLFQLLGGIGLFLIGMSLLSEGLTTFAGSSLQKALARFTGTPFKAFLSGATITALVQSSSATTITLIGFVSAGLITFSQAIGVVIGASLGTTFTGWIISTLGLKISLGFYVLPFIGIGAFLKLLGHGRWPALGLAVAGFGILFVGIDTMQAGVSGIDSHFSLSFAGDDVVTWWHRLLTMLAGIIMTVIMQSSTAMVATSMTALSAGAINFEQAAILVIGAAIGTTFTGILAAIGGSIMARRTALAHVLFNLSSGIIAMLLLPVLLWCVQRLQHYFEVETGAVGLAVFNTLFLALGVAIFLPQATRCARLIERILPERPNNLVQQLDKSQQQVPELALSTLEQTLTTYACSLISETQRRCKVPGSNIDRQKQEDLKEGLSTIKQYFAGINFTEEHKELTPLRLSQTHVIDHLQRLYARASEIQLVSIENPPAIFKQAAQHSDNLLSMACAGLSSETGNYWLDEMAEQYHELSELRLKAREQIMQETATGFRTSTEALSILDSMRWLVRTNYHVWRICYYLRSKDPVVGEEHLAED